MHGTVRVVRDGQLKLSIPARLIEVRSDGTLWHNGMPILGITDPAIVDRVAADIRRKRYNTIPPDAYTRLGDNPNGLWAGDDTAWAAHPLGQAEARQQAEAAAQAARRVTIYLSGRGWGDYSPVEWTGDITRPDVEIVRECQAALLAGHDVDQPNQQQADLLAKIHVARTRWTERPAREATAQAAEQRRQQSGYCYNCESWCDGDCGHYSNDPAVGMARDLKEAGREAMYGIEDGE